MRTFYAYIMSNGSRTLYTGVTNNLERRVLEHKTGMTGGFTAQYRVKWLVWMEEFPDVRDAIAREKQIKGWSRKKKYDPVMESNPTWKDLAADWYDEAALAEFGASVKLPRTSG
jgi:putative endonuclease